MGATLRSRVIMSLALVFGICLLFPLIPQPSLAQITFETTYGGTSDDHGWSVQQTQDCGYIITGPTWSFGAGGTDVYLIKTDSLGDTVWTRTYGGSNYDLGLAVKQTRDGGYIIAATTASFGVGDYDVYLVRTDSLGDSIWTRTHGGTSGEIGRDVEQTLDGGYIIAGDTRSFGAGGADVYLVRTDSLGDSIWTRTCGGSNEDYGSSVQQTQDGGYIIAGTTSSFGVGSRDVYLIKTDSLGDTVWTRTYGGSSSDHGFAVEQTQDGGYIIAGETWSFGAGGLDVYLIKAGSLGDSIWTRTYGGSNEDYGSSVQQTQDGGYIIAGTTSSFGVGSLDVYLIKTDSLGDTVWTRTYGGSDGDWSGSGQQTLDGGYIIAGQTESFGAGGSDVYLIKTNENGLTGVQEQRSTFNAERLTCVLLQSRPNPFSTSTVISYYLSLLAEVSLDIYDITGRLVETLANERLEPGNHQVRWNRKANPSGVYFYQLKAGEFVETRKMVVVE